MLTHSNQVYKSLPSPEDIKQFQFVMGRSASAIFNASTGLPSRSSPVCIFCCLHFKSSFSSTFFEEKFQGIAINQTVVALQKL
jgi:hypothetical protein